MMYLEDEQKRIEADFMLSWDQMEIFFGDDDMPWMTQMLPLIRALRARGYDRKLRAGQSMTTFIVSRSREHGLRISQPSLAFNITPQRGIRAQLTGEHVSVMATADRIEITPDIENLLIPLLAYPID
jgi:hypothetical protein